MDELWMARVKWAIYDLLGVVSVEEIITNRELIASFTRLERLLKIWR